MQKTKRKLQRSYVGPYIISKFENPTAVILKRLSDGKIIEKPVSVRRLKRGHVRARTNAWDPLPDPGPEIVLNEEDIPDSNFEPQKQNTSNSNSDDPQTTDNTTAQCATQSNKNASDRSQAQTSGQRVRTTRRHPVQFALPDTSVMTEDIIPPLTTRTSMGRATRRSGAYQKVSKVTGVRIDRPTGELKFHCLFLDGSYEWVISSRVNGRVRSMGKEFIPAGW